MKIPLSELILMPFPLIRRMCELKASEADRAKGGNDWNPDEIPEPENPDGPPPKELFVAYGCAIGMSKEKAEAEYERQVKQGGYGKVVDRNGKPY